MKYIPLVWAGLWRKRARTIFTFLSVAVAFLLFGLLQGVDQAFTGAVTLANVDRLLVSSRFSFLEPLPLGDLAQIEAVPGINRVTYLDQFGAYYRDPKIQILVTPFDLERSLAVYQEIKAPKDQIEAMKRLRTGVLVGKPLADALGLKVGDRLPLRTAILKQDGGTDWTFDVVGIYDAPDSPGIAQFVLANFSYFDEARALGKGTVLRFVIQLKDPHGAIQVADAVDRLFANSANETKTQSQKEYSQSLLKQFGDIDFLLAAIIAAVFFTLLLVAANTMMQSVRERIPEFAVLKTLGFSETGVAAIVLGESVLLCLTASLLGLAAAAPLVPAVTGATGVTAPLPLGVIAAGIVVALVIAIASALPPALRVRRLSIVDALAGR